MLVKQIREILRRLQRSPMFTAVTLITLAVGVGANTAVFSVLESVVLKPLAYPHPEELVGLWHSAPGFNVADLEMSPSNYFIYREQNHSFQEIGLYLEDSTSVTGVGEPEQVPTLDVTEGTLPVLGIPPMLGRWFNGNDTTSKSAGTVMLTYGYWQHRFGGDPAAVGRAITVDGKLRQIIGIMPQHFHFLDQDDPALILPIALDRDKTTLGNFSYDSVARLRPGVTLQAANRDVDRMLPMVWSSFPTPPGFSAEIFKKAQVAPNLRPLKRDLVGDINRLLWILMGSIGMVLLIACANVANLLLVRTEARQQELAIRAALGASRRRLSVELLIESFVIGLLGSALGLGLAYASLRALVAISPQGLHRIREIGIDLPVLLFTLAVSLLTSLLFGSIPVLKYAGAHLGAGLRGSGRTVSASRERHRARNSLVVVQVALAFVLLVGSGLMLRTFRALTHVDPGFHVSDTQTLRLTIPEAQVPDPEQATRMHEQIMRRIAAVPGVSMTGLTNSVPMDGNGWTDPVFAEDHNYGEGEFPSLRKFKFVAPGAFSTLGIPIIAGSDFTWNEIYDRLPVAIISENFAREYWHDPASALGKRIRSSTKDDWREIIGVVGDVRYDGMNQNAPSLVYWPILMSHFDSDPVQVRRTLTYVLRSSRAGSESLLREVRQAVWSVNANLPLADVRPLAYYYDRSMARTSFTLVMLALASGLALLLGSVGLYGVIAYSVMQRRREIGIRSALGAQRSELTGMFIRHGLWLTAMGIGGGLLVAVFTMRIMSSLLFHVSAADPATYAMVALGLVTTAALASYIPSRRAAKVDPCEALRSE